MANVRGAFKVPSLRTRDLQWALVPCYVGLFMTAVRLGGREHTVTLQALGDLASIEGQVWALNGRLRLGMQVSGIQVWVAAAVTKAPDAALEGWDFPCGELPSPEGVPSQ